MPLFSAVRPRRVPARPKRVRRPVPIAPEPSPLPLHGPLFSALAAGSPPSSVAASPASLADVPASPSAKRDPARTGRLRPFLSVPLLLLLLLVLPAAPAAASSIEISPSAQAAFEKTAAKASPEAAKRMNDRRRQYAAQLQELEAARKQAQDAHAAAAKLATAVRQAATAIDDEAIRVQQARIAKAKSVYEPLYAGYTALGQRSRSAGSKEMAKALRLQADLMKSGVQLARQAVRLQEDQLKELRRARSAKIAVVRKTLADLEPLNDTLRVRKASARIPEAALRDAIKDFSAAARKGDAALVERALGSMLGSGSQLLAQWRAIVELERQYSGIAEQARRQLAGYGVKAG